MTNNYHKILLYLKQFEGDGEFHEIESLFVDFGLLERNEIFQELAREELIYLTGGNFSGLPLMGFADTNGKVDWVGGSDRSVYIPYQAKLKFKGSKYLKEELEMTDQGKYNINVEGNSTANVIIGSPGATINNKTEIIDKVKHILETIKNDDTLNDSEKQQAIETFTQLETEIVTNNTKSLNIEKVMTIGAKISSIGSLVVALTKLLLGL